MMIVWITIIMYQIKNDNSRYERVFTHYCHQFNCTEKIPMLLTNAIIYKWKKKKKSLTNDHQPRAWKRVLLISGTWNYLYKCPALTSPRLCLDSASKLQALDNTPRLLSIAMPIKRKHSGPVLTVAVNAIWQMTVANRLKFIKCFPFLSSNSCLFIEYFYWESYSYKYRV